MFDKRYEETINTVPAGLHYNLEHGLLVRWEGTLVNQISGNSIALVAENMEYLWKQRFHVHQRLPMMDKFQVNLTDWAGRTKDSGDFTGITEVVHDQETAK